MSTTFTFPSIADAHKRYRVWEGYDDNPAHDWRSGSDHVSSRVSCFSTLGDGETQHEPDRLVYKSDSIDFIASLFAGLALVEPGTMPDSIERLLNTYNEPSKEFLEFCWNLKRPWDKERSYPKRTYVNLRDMKKSSADSKRHDKRWLEVEEYICAEEQGSYDKKIQSLWCLVNRKENPNNPTDWIDTLGYLVAFNEKLKIGPRSIAEFFRDWDVMKGTTVDECEEMLKQFSIIRTWYSTTHTAIWCQNRFKDAAEKVGTIEAVA